MKILLITIIILKSIFGFSQVSMRDIIVTADTVHEINNLKKKSEVVEINMIKGLRINVIDSPFRVFYFHEVEKNNLNGIHFEFFIRSGMPKEKGSYIENEKNGEWYYWNEKGQLIRRETWNKGKLQKKESFKG